MTHSYGISITVVSMTDPNNSNEDQQRPLPDDAQRAGEPEAGHSSNHAEDDLWTEFERNHEQDLKDIAASRDAKRFEHHAKRKEKERLLSVNDLDEGAFTDDTPRTGHGPRDFTASSWLDTDDVMDQSGDDFVAPNPHIGHIPVTKLVLWALFIVGVFGTILSVFIPALAGVLSTIFGTCALLGGAGLVIGHRGHTQTRSDIFDDGSRV